MIKRVNQSSYDVKKTGYNVFLQGAKLGIFATGLGSFLFPGFYLSILWISAKLNGVGIVSENMVVDSQGYLEFFFIVYWVMGLPLTFLVSVIPGVLGGLSNAWILKTLAQSNRLTLIQGAASGMLVGIVFSAIPLYAGILFAGKFFDDPLFMEMIISGILAATITGVWHGLRTTRYILRKYT